MNVIYAVTYIEAWKIQDFNGIWNRDLVKPVRRSNQLRCEATGSGFTAHCQWLRSWLKRRNGIVGTARIIAFIRLSSLRVLCMCAIYAADFW